MGILGEIMRRMLAKALLILFIAIGLAASTVVFIPMVKTDDSMFILTAVQDSMKYERLTDNTMKCDLATYSNIVLKMLEDGYEITDEEYSEDFIDIVLSQNGVSYRLYYEQSGDFISLSDVYEKVIYL